MCLFVETVPNKVDFIVAYFLHCFPFYRTIKAFMAIKNFVVAFYYCNKVMSNQFSLINIQMTRK